MNGSVIDLYVQVKQPDKEAMKEALIAIKGANRTMAELAAEANLSKTMLSRIYNMNYSKPIAPEVLEKLASCSPKDCRYDLIALLEINGMLTKEQVAKDNLMSKRSNNSEKRKLFNAMSDILTKDLLATGYAIKQIKTQDMTGWKVSNVFSQDVRVADMAICMPEKGNLKWGFAIINDYRPDDYSDEEDAAFIAMTLARYYQYFIQDASAPDSLNNSKFTFVFADKTYYYLFAEAMLNIKTNNRISSILIDLFEEKVVEEQFFICKNHELEDVSVFRQAYSSGPLLKPDNIVAFRDKDEISITDEVIESINTDTVKHLMDILMSKKYGEDDENARTEHAGKDGQ